MDCYFHSNVPSVAPCVHCGKAICATCRDDQGGCPSCRLAEKIDATTGERKQLWGQVPPRPNPAPPAAAPRAHVTTISDDPVESRALVALGYPLWPLALLALLDSKRSKYIKRQALQALGFNVGFAAFWALLELTSMIPVLGWSSTFVLVMMLPLFILASVVFGIKAWHGEPVRVPVISDWLDERMPA
ncbi:MAG TPA: DUF4870 domain-containing protein [Candidatus Baltobacteraceae bacterium]|nr:DUF4870 domain-containing protein [Candidatus Baltobacteraceae bacterium]